jgi:hypothetical protein
MRNQITQCPSLLLWPSCCMHDQAFRFASLTAIATLYPQLQGVDKIPEDFAPKFHFVKPEEVQKDKDNAPRFVRGKPYDVSTPGPRTTHIRLTDSQI